MFSRLMLATLFAVAAPAALEAKGPPWISIELPGNPYDRDTHGAFLLVHAFHHGTSVDAPVSGTAEGIVNGRRRSIPLTLVKTSRPGVYALRNQWGNAGRWVLVLTVTQSEHGDDIAQAVVEVADGGTVTAVRVPTRASGDMTLPRRVTAAEIESVLATNARP